MKIILIAIFNLNFIYMLKQIRYILAACNQGQKKIGVEQGPKTVAHFLDKYEYINNEKFNNSNGYKILKENVSKEIKNNNIPITLGGDHSISLGSISGTLENESDLTVIWVDAHPDINTKKSSSTGNLHGMPLSFLTGIEDDKYEFQENYLKPENIIYIGIRDIDPFEQEIIDKYKIQYLTSEDINYNMDFLNKLIVKTKNIHLSLDVDVLDEKYMPCTGTIVNNGIDMKQLEDIIKWSSNQGTIISADVVELNPYLGRDKEVTESINNYYKILCFLQKYLN